MTKKEFKSQLLPLQSKLLRLAVTMTSRRAAAEDITQDVFAKCWEMRDELADYNSIEALAVTMTKNRCIDQLRSYRNRHQNENGIEGLMILDDASDPVKMFEAKDSLQYVHEIMQELPNRQRYILHLRGVEQYSYDEIEEITELTRNNIRVILSRARKKLREEYKKMQNYDQRRN